MPTENATVAIYDTPAETAKAIRELRDAGFGPRSLSVAGKDVGAGTRASVCYYSSGDDLRYVGDLGPFWNSVWEQLSGWACLTIPAFGSVLVAGPLAGWIVAGLQNASIFTGLTAFGAGLYSIGINKDAIAEYEAALVTGKYLLVAHGPAGEVAEAKKLLKSRVGGTTVKLSA